MCIHFYQRVLTSASSKFKWINKESYHSSIIVLEKRRHEPSTSWHYKTDVYSLVLNQGIKNAILSVKLAKFSTRVNLSYNSHAGSPPCTSN